MSSYVVPTKRIKTAAQLNLWKSSNAYKEIVGFIGVISDSVKGLPNDVEFPTSPAVARILAMLDQLSDVVERTPPIEQPQRFGNKAFSQWHATVTETADELLLKMLDESDQAAVCELSPYLLDSFGNATRIDYGTGHELSFVAFLYCLYRIGLLGEPDRKATALAIFSRYLKLVRKLQTTYCMEPAGSHGVWSLDDFQFVPFIWGSAQMIGQGQVAPEDFVKPEVVNKYQEKYMFLSCIQHIMKVKTGPFYEHSNQLWSISGVPSWTKVNQGLLKMYKGEVLDKLPIVQHFFFGSLIPWPETA